MASLAPSLVRQQREVNRRWPHRDHWSDGWLGDDSHATRFSDHNPAEPNPPGYVHATDTDATVEHKMGSGNVGDEVCAAALRLARSGKPHPINYIIYKGIIYSRSYGFRARKYYGSNGHFSHVHISILRTTWARFWDGSWGIDIPTMDISRIVYAFDGHKSASPVHVARFQKRLREKGYLTRPYIAGRAGRKTKNALKKWQKRHGFKEDGIPGPTQIKRIAGRFYRVVK